MMKPATTTILALAALTAGADAGVMSLGSIYRDVRANHFRELDAPGSLEELLNDVESNTTSSSWSGEASIELDTLDAWSTQSSNMASTQISASGTWGGTESNPNDMYRPNMYSHVSSSFDVSFSLTEDTEFSLDVVMSSMGANWAWFELYQVGGDFNIIDGIVNGPGTTDNLELHESFTLSEGSYRFYFLRDDGDHLERDSYHEFEYDIALNIIPAPSALALLSLSGILTTRRRR